MKHDHQIVQKSLQYLKEEPLLAFRKQVETLMASEDVKSRDELAERMSSCLRFGTAGLRGRMEAGYNRMNMVTVYRFSFALSLEIKCSAIAKKVLIGFDGRKLSRDFAHEAAHIFSAQGIEVHLFNDNVPTPLCAYATKNLKASFGVMITASHNPACDNGIKLFHNSSAQAYGEILHRLENYMVSAPLRTDFMRSSAPDKNAIKQVPEHVFLDYLREIKTTRFFDQPCSDDVPIVYTPLHGVGKTMFMRALNDAGFHTITLVDAQAEPDATFPTTPFPNPEENHTLDMAHELALKNNLNWVFASDPDADRLQVSARTVSGSFKKLSGNEMGALLAYFAIRRARELGIKPLVASSIVSSRMTKAMCKKLGAHYVDALTGFSNIVAASGKAESVTGYRFVFGYEEAIGFLVGNVVLDKDGINAGARFMEIVCYLKQSNKTVWDFLDELMLQYGLFVTSQWSIRFDGIGSLDAMKQVMKQVIAMPSSQMAHCLTVSGVQKYDLNNEQTHNSYEGMQANVVIFESDQARLIIRPSGTEPKIKFYLELNDQATDVKYLSMKRSALEQKLHECRSHIEILLGG